MNVNNYAQTNEIGHFLVKPLKKSREEKHNHFVRPFVLHYAGKS